MHVDMFVLKVKKCAHDNAITITLAKSEGQY